MQPIVTTPWSRPYGSNRLYEEWAVHKATGVAHIPWSLQQYLVLPVVDEKVVVEGLVWKNEVANYIVVSADEIKTYDMTINYQVDWHTLVVSVQRL